MEFILDVNGIKRRFETPAFAIYGKRADLAALMESLRDELQREPHVTAGWVDVRPPVPPVPCTANTAPISWNDPASAQRTGMA